MRKRLFSLISFCFVALGLCAQTLVFHASDGSQTQVSLPADMHIDTSKGVVTFTSGSARVDIPLGAVKGVPLSSKIRKGDVNEDGKVDIADVVSVLNIMASQVPDKAPDGVVAVDLDLPSGTLWANMNVGATSVSDNGLYFAWGETVGYTGDTSDGRLFDLANYKWMKEGQSDWKSINKYQTADGTTDACWYQYNWNTLDYDFIGDGLTELLSVDDVAHAYWGGDWHMPTRDEIEELVENTTYEWITTGGVSGAKFTSKTNGNAIFLPAAGFRQNDELNDAGSCGYYWSSMLYESYPNNARRLYFSSGGGAFWGSFGRRYYGFPVRPVMRYD